MVYNNKDVRRQDRLLSEDRALEILKTAEYGVLSMIDENGLPYAVPVNHIYDGKQSVYIHCAPQGKKLRAIENNPCVSFCVVGDVNLKPNKFTTEYESVILKGNARTGLSDEEKMHALNLLLEKLSPNDVSTGLKYAQKSFHRTEIIRIDIEEYSGKAKYMH